MENFIFFSQHTLWSFIYLTHFIHKNIYLKNPPPPCILMVAP